MGRASMPLPWLQGMSVSDHLAPPFQHYHVSLVFLDYLLCPFCPGPKPSGSFIEQSPEWINWLHWLHFATHTCPGLLSGWPLSSLLFEIVNTLTPSVSRDGFSTYPNNPESHFDKWGFGWFKTQFSKNGILSKPLQPCLQPPTHMAASVKRALGLNSEVFILALNVTITIISNYYNNICHLVLAWNVIISLLSTLHTFLTKILQSSVIFSYLTGRA